MSSRERDPVDGEDLGRSKVADRNIESLHRAIEIQADIGGQIDERTGGGGVNFKGDFPQPDAITSRWWSVTAIRIKVILAGHLDVTGRHGLTKRETLPGGGPDHGIERRVDRDRRPEVPRPFRRGSKAQTEATHAIGIGSRVPPDADLGEGYIAPKVEDQNRHPCHRDVVRRKTTRRTSNPESSRTTPRLVMRFSIRESRSRSLDKIGSRPEVVGR